jgi:XapX domain-containing protein
MLKLLIGCCIAFGIGAGCRYFNIPTPAPSALKGVLLVAMMTLGYIAVDRALTPGAPAAQAQSRLQSQGP